MKFIDNFLPEETFKILDGLKDFWVERGTYFWHWRFDKDNTIGDILLQEYDKAIGVPSEAVGLEYWPGVFTANDEPGPPEENGQRYVLPLHVDKDEMLYGKTGEIKNPIEGAVIYFTECEGGLLHAYNEDGYFFLQPRRNRLVMFDVSVPHGVTPVTRGIRRNISFNFWAEQPLLEDDENIS